MIRTFQLTKALSLLTVIDNMRLGAQQQPGENFFKSFIRPLWSANEKRITVKADELLQRFKLDAKREDYAASLSGGQRKLLEMARALMSDPKLVMLDEPMAGMNVEEKREMCRFILKVNDEIGTTIVLIEHDMGVVMDISDRVVVLDYGKVIGDGVPDEVRSSQAVIDAYLGASHD
jgi:branched-chain amino acid transport system ATP-binding protein